VLWGSHRTIVGSSDCRTAACAVQPGRLLTRRLAGQGGNVMTSVTSYVLSQSDGETAMREKPALGRASLASAAVPSPAPAAHLPAGP
jgi:hypothetical protein